MIAAGHEPRSAAAAREEPERGEATGRRLDPRARVHRVRACWEITSNGWRLRGRNKSGRVAVYEDEQSVYSIAKSGRAKDMNGTFSIKCSRMV